MIAKQKHDLGYYFGYANYFKDDFNGRELPVWNTQSIVDIWLAKNCKLPFIQERLHEQYSENWIGWIDDLNFSEKGFLITAETEKSNISPFLSSKDDNSIEFYEDLLIYGTTYAHKFLHQVLEGVIRGESYKIKEDDLYVNFEIFGLSIQYKNKTYYIGEKEVTYLYSPKPDFLFSGEKDDFYKYFIDYQIKHSFTKNDFNNYQAPQIIMSHEDECFNVDFYKDFDFKQMNRYFMLLPRYIKLN